MTDPSKGLITYIEVKTTRYADKNVFALSLREWEFACMPGIDYRVYRVFCGGNREQVRVAVVDDLHRKVEEGSVQLCLAI